MKFPVQFNQNNNRTCRKDKTIKTKESINEKEKKEEKNVTEKSTACVVNIYKKYMREKKNPNELICTKNMHSSFSKLLKQKELNV